jgi:hypothetical protein
LFEATVRPGRGWGRRRAPLKRALWVCLERLLETACQPRGGPPRSCSRSMALSTEELPAAGLSKLGQ